MAESKGRVLGDFCKIESGYPFKTKSWQESGVPVVKIKNVGDGVVSLEDCSFVSAEVASLAEKFYVKEGDVLVSLTGYVGQVGRIQPNETALVNQRVGLVRPFDKSELDFLFYFLRASRVAIENLATGSAQANVSPLDIMKLPYPGFSADAKHRITQLLKTLDSKIALNVKKSKVLEQIAQTIFKSWFVDFDPVHAKARGEQPEGMDAETAALFPDSFEDSELGPIPAGFSLATFKSFAEVLLGGTPSKSKPEYWDGSIPWINSGAINDFRVIEATRNITELGLQKSSCKLLPRGTTVIAITGATLGQFSRVEIETTANQSVIGISPFEKYLNDYVYLWVSGNIGQITSKATGGAQQHINRNDVCEQLVLLPTAEIALKFSEVLSPFFELISNLLFQNHALSQLRDSLLPRLISGELEIPEELLGE